MQNPTDYKKDNLILLVLLMALFVQVFNAASLYAHFSNLTDIMKFIGSAFIGISAEAGIFICIYAGSRPAGKFFAILSFFVGILFHATFTELESIDFWTTKKFIASSLMQIINSSLVWFLSELYVNRTEIEQDKSNIESLKQTIATLRETERDLSITITELIDTNKYLEKNRSEIEHKITKHEIRKADIEHEITVLQKQKAGMSKTKVNSEF